MTRQQPQWRYWVNGWCSLLDGIAIILSLGYYDPSLRYHWAVRNIVSLAPTTGRQ